MSRGTVVRIGAIFDFREIAVPENVRHQVAICVRRIYLECIVRVIIGNEMFE